MEKLAPTTTCQSKESEQHQGGSVSIHSTLDFSSGHLTVVRLSPASGHSQLKIFSLPLPMTFPRPKGKEPENEHVILILWDSEPP